MAIRNLALGQGKFLRVDDGSEQIAIDGSPAGDPIIVWNGTGVSDTGGDWTLDGYGTESSSAKYSGTNGLNSGVRSIDEETIFNYGSNVAIDGYYDTLSFWLNPQSVPTGSEIHIGWKDDYDVDVGVIINVGDYVSNLDSEVWQNVSLPIEDFQLSSNEVAQLVFTYAQVSINLLIAARNVNWKSDSFAGIADGLSAGVILRHRRLSDGTIMWSSVIRNNMDLFGKLWPSYEFNFSDNEVMLNFTLKTRLATIIVTTDDVLEIVIGDDLSSLTNIRGYVQYGTEEEVL
jgi:hypothetical protein